MCVTLFRELSDKGMSQNLSRLDTMFTIPATFLYSTPGFFQKAIHSLKSLISDDMELKKFLLHTLDPTIPTSVQCTPVPGK